MGYVHGTLVERHREPGVAEEGYSVEFFDMTGNTVAMITVAASALRVHNSTDRPAVRAFSAQSPTQIHRRRRFAVP